MFDFNGSSHPFSWSLTKAQSVTPPPLRLPLAWQRMAVHVAALWWCQGHPQTIRPLWPMFHPRTEEQLQGYPITLNAWGGGVVGTYNPKKTSTNPTTWDLAETWWNEKKGHLSILMFFWLVVHWRIFNGIHMNLVGLFGIVLVWFWHTVAGRKSKRHPRHIEQAKSKNKHLV